MEHKDDIVIKVREELRSQVRVGGQPGLLTTPLRPWGRGREESNAVWDRDTWR